MVNSKETFYKGKLASEKYEIYFKNVTAKLLTKATKHYIIIKHVKMALKQDVATTSIF